MNATWPLASEPSCAGVSLCPAAAMSPTYGAVTLILVDKPRRDRFYVFCLASDIPATRLPGLVASAPD